MAKRRPLCKCGHRYYKHSTYPLDSTYCKGIIAPKYSDYNCMCIEYETLSNLEYLESKYLESVDKNP